MMISLRTTLVVGAALVVLTSGRVLQNSQAGQLRRDQNNIAELLLYADPLENEIFNGVRYSQIPSSVTPAHHVVQSLLRPRYVDASEFRSQGFLPPVLDINRQLTILSASHRIVPPTKVVLLSEDITEDNFDNVYFLDTSPLFREDFPTEEFKQDQKNAYKVKEDLIVSPVDIIQENPKLSTSISMSSSASSLSAATPSTETSPATPAESSPATSSTETSPTKPSIEASPATSSTETSPAKPSIEASPATSSTEESPATPSTQTSSETSSTQTSALTVSKRFSAARTAAQGEAISSLELSVPLTIGGSTQKLVAAEYPDYSALSPLAHILSGFVGELSPIGRDAKADTFVRGFRPMEF